MLLQERYKILKIQMDNDRNILVIAAHPDDEVLGCGGAIARHASLGDTVHIIFMTNGVSSRDTFFNRDIEKRKKEARQAADILGASSVFSFDFPDNQMDSVPLLDIVKSIENKIKKITPEIIYTHHIGDLNIDHQITHKAVMTACRPQPGFCVQKIYNFEILSSTEWSTKNLFVPNYFIDISNSLELKIQAMKSYDSELYEFPHPRSIKSIKLLAQYRGSSVGLELAESFMIARILSHNS